jgi:hypothetical protein
MNGASDLMVEVFGAGRHARHRGVASIRSGSPIPKRLEDVILACLAKEPATGGPPRLARFRGWSD